MVGGSVEGLTGLLEAIAGWGSVAGRELGESLGNPSNVPVFLSSLIKFSLGPTMAFGFARWSVLRDEKRKEEKEAEAVRSLLRLEIDHNLEEMGNLNTRLPDWSVNHHVWGSEPTFYAQLARTGLLNVAFDRLVESIPRTLTKDEVQKVYRHYTVVNQVLEKRSLYKNQETGSRSRGKNFEVTGEEDCRFAYEVAELEALLEETLDRGNPLD